MAKAEIDECYNGVGKPFVPGPLCSAGEKPKANQNYLWGLAKSGDDIWIATGSNILCLMDATTAFAAGFDLPPVESDLRVCEYNRGQYLSYMGEELVSNIFSDFRPPFSLHGGPLPFSVAVILKTAVKWSCYMARRSYRCTCHRIQAAAGRIVPTKWAASPASSALPALTIVLLTGDGFGNFTNYGFRTKISDDSGLYIGTANPANIAQDDSGHPVGGWELIQVVQVTR